MKRFSLKTLILTLAFLLWGLVTPAQAQNGQPYQKTTHVSTGRVAWNPRNTSQQAVIHVDWEVKVVATNDPPAKWIVLTTKGAGVTPGTLATNTDKIKGYFHNDIMVEYGIAGQDWKFVNQLPNGFSIDRHAPENANDSSDLSVSTGWQVGGQAGLDGKTPGGSLSASYSEGRTTTVSYRDFQVTNRTDAVRGIWQYRLSKLGDGTPITRAKDWVYEKVFKGNFLRPLPPLALNNMRLSSELVYRLPVHATGQVRLLFKVTQGLLRMEEYGNWATWRTRSDNPGYIAYASTTVNLNEVQAPGVVAAGQLYNITSAATGKNVDVWGGGKENGVKVVTWVDNGQQYQKWTIEDAGKYKKIISRNSGKALDVTYGVAPEGAPMRQWDFVNASNQLWTLQDTGNGLYKIISVASGMVLEARADGSLVVASDSGRNNQLWRLTPTR